MTGDDAWVAVAEVAEIPEGGLAFAVPSHPLSEGGILVRVGGEVAAWLNRCRHLAVPLDGAAPGEFLTGDRRHLACSRHGALYRLEDGVCVSGPCAGSSLRRLAIEVRLGKVFLNTASLPAPLSGGRDEP